MLDGPDPRFARARTTRFCESNSLRERHPNSYTGFSICCEDWVALYDENAFTAELKLIWSTVTSLKPRWYKMGSQNVEIEDAWRMYKNAPDCNLPELLMGD